MRKTIGHKYDIDWDAFFHAILSGVGSAVCIYLNIFAAVHMTGISGKMKLENVIICRMSLLLFMRTTRTLFSHFLVTSFFFRRFYCLEPLGSVQCNGALTSLHRVIPAITQGK